MATPCNIGMGITIPGNIGMKILGNIGIGMATPGYIAMVTPGNIGMGMTTPGNIGMAILSREYTWENWHGITRE